MSMKNIKNNINKEGIGGVEGFSLLQNQLWLNSRQPATTSKRKLQSIVSKSSPTAVIM